MKFVIITGKLKNNFRVFALAFLAKIERGWQLQDLALISLHNQSQLDADEHKTSKIGKAGNMIIAEEGHPL